MNEGKKRRGEVHIWNKRVTQMNKIIKKGLPYSNYNSLGGMCFDEVLIEFVCVIYKIDWGWEARKEKGI